MNVHIWQPSPNPTRGKSQVECTRCGCVRANAGQKVMYYRGKEILSKSPDCLLG